MYNNIVYQYIHFQVLSKFRFIEHSNAKHTISYCIQTYFKNSFMVLYVYSTLCELAYNIRTLPKLENLNT